MSSIFHSAFCNLHSALNEPESLRLAAFSGLDAALAHRRGESVDEAAGVFPTDASVRDALAIEQLFAGHEILAAGFEMAFDHDAEDS